MAATIVGLMVCAAVYMVRFIHKEIKSAKEEVEMMDFKELCELMDREKERRKKG